MDPKTLNILILTHRAVFGELLAQTLGRLRGVARARTADGGREALALVRRGAADLLLIDPAHVEDGVFDVARRALRMRRHRPAVVFFGEEARAGWLRRAISVGASAVLDAEADAAEYARAVRAVAAGKGYFSPSAARVLADLASGRLPTITDREIEVLRLICRGLSSKDAARRLGLSPRSIDAHRARLIAKFGVRNAFALVHHACRERYVDC